MLKIGVAQIRNSVNVEENFLTILKSLKAFELNKPDVILFPECALSGFSSKIKDSTLDVLRSYLDEVGIWSKQNNVTVFLPTALKSGAIYNTGFCFQNGDVNQFYKLGLTESEKKFFTIPDHSTSKIFNVKGCRIGLLICFEAEMNPYEYFDEGSVDVILWPGYWGWIKDDNWCSNKKNGEENKIYKNMSEWKVPLIQSNFAFNDLNDYRASGPHGLSMFVNSENQLMGQGGFEKEECYLINVDNSCCIKNIETLSI
jgi:predicted amidohydrolase